MNLRFGLLWPFRNPDFARVPWKDLYRNHLEEAKLQLAREPRVLPKLVLNDDVRSIFDFDYEDFAIEGYDPHPHIPVPVAV